MKGHYHIKVLNSFGKIFFFDEMAKLSEQIIHGSR